jgi:hypothetical protein
MGASFWNEAEDKRGANRGSFDDAGTATGQSSARHSASADRPAAVAPQVAQHAVGQPAAATKAAPQPQQNQVHSISEPEKKFRDARNPPPGATECRHWAQRYAATKIGRRRAVQSLIRAEGVLGRFELAETPFFSRLKKTNPSRRKKVAEVS